MENNSLRPDRYYGNSTLQVKEIPHNRKGKMWKSGIVITSIAIAACISAVLLFNNSDKGKLKEPEVLTESPVKEFNPAAEALRQYGNVTMLGKFGAAPATLIIDFNTMTGTRNYNSTPNEKYTLKIESINCDNEDNYTLIITDMLEGRIPIGTYNGQFDGSTFKGTYNSKHGKRRDFNFSI